MVTKVLQAAIRCPELLSGLNLGLFTGPDILLGFKALSIHKPNPPLFYTQFVYSFLRTKPEFKPYVLILNDLEYNSIRSIGKSIIKNYYKLQYVPIPPFSNPDTVEMIGYCSDLCSDDKYTRTAFLVLDELCDNLIRKPEFVDEAQCDILINTLTGKTKTRATETLIKMCKVSTLRIKIE
jgi:hypothetical protein